jgi:DNA-directed RNA polymerase subunit L
MRTYLLIIALAALAAAQATQPGIATQIINLPDTIKTTINDISYSLVKQRTELPQITVPLPAAAYKDYGNIKLIVIAIPYSPEEDPDQAIRDAINKLIDTSKNFNQRVSEAIKELLSIRSVFYPYETFRVRLIFIMFVHTQTLIDYAIETSANLLNSGNKQSGAALYTNSIMEILYAKYQTWKSSNKPKLENKINSFKLQTSQSGDTITFTGQVDGKTVLEFSVTVTASTNTVCKISSSVGQIYESFTDELADEIRTTLPKLDLEDLQRVFAGKNDINNIVNDFNTEIDNYYTTIINNEKTMLSGIIKGHINSLFNKYNNTICSSDDCDCENNKKQMIDSILQQSSSLESWLKNSYKQMLEDIDGTINNCLGVVNDIKSSLLPNCDNDNSCKMIRNTLEDFGNNVAGKIGSVAGRCVGKYLGEIAKKSINSVVSTIPVVNLGYILANGIMGALQKQVTIEGKIVSEPVLAGGLGGFKVYNVSNRIACYSREIRDISGQNFVSEPSTSEAIFAAIKGFISAVTQLYGGKLGKAVDLIPIIRTVDMPKDGYFMFIATPGVYVLKIDNLNARSIIDKFKDDIKKKIQENLAESYNKGSKCELYKKINDKVKNVLGTTNLGNRTALYQEAYGKDYDYNNRESDTSTLTLNLYFVVIPPYMAGTRFGSGYNYILVADLFGVLRSFLFPAIGDVRRQIVSSTNICPVSTAHTSPGVGSAVESACVNIVSNAVGVVNNAMSHVINNLFEFKIDSKNQISCSLEDVLAYSVKAAIYAARDAIKTKISDTISEMIIEPLAGKIGQSVCSWLGDQVGNQIEEGLSSLLEMLFDLYGTSGFQSQKMSYSFRASYDSNSNRLKEAFCRLVGNPQIITYLGLHAVRIFDAAEEGLYVPSYFLSAYPIQFKESPTARWCYSVVISPYYIYTQPPLPTREKEVKSLLIDALDVIRDNDNLKTGLLNFLRDKYVQTKILWVFSWQGNAVKENNKVACKPWGLQLLPPFFDPYLDFNQCWDNGDLRWTIDSLKLGPLSQSDRQFLGGILMQRARMIEVPVLAGVNKYFDAFKVYPAMAVREVGNPNPYYFVVPYSTPARELFVLGTVGDVVVYDGSLKTAGGDKPFLYYNVTR